MEVILTTFESPSKQTGQIESTITNETNETSFFADWGQKSARIENYYQNLKQNNVLFCIISSTQNCVMCACAFRECEADIFLNENEL